MEIRRRTPPVSYNRPRPIITKPSKNKAEEQVSWGAFAIGYLMGESNGQASASSSSESKANFDLTIFWVAGALSECVALVLLVCGYISLFDFGLQLPVPVGLAATVVAIAVYLALHGDKRTTLAMLVLLTPLWTLGVYFWENPQTRLHPPLLQACPSIHDCVQHVFPGGNVRWGWTLFAFLAALIFRGVLYSMVRQASTAEVPVWVGVGQRTWMWLKRLGIAVGIALVAAVVFGMILKACHSEP